MQRGELCLVANVRHAVSPDIAKILGQAGFDAMMLDFEQTGVDYQQAGHAAIAAIDTGITPLVRVADLGIASIGRALVVGALGIVAPHVETAEEAVEVVRHCRFAPRGDRGVAPMFPHFGYRPIAAADAVAQLEAVTTVVAMIESPAGVDNVDAIAAVDGVDVVFVGCSDLSFELGKPAAYDDPEILAACAATVAACRRHGKVAGVGGFSELHRFQRMVDLGMRYFAAGTDTAFLIAGATARAAGLRALSPSKETLCP